MAAMRDLAHLQFMIRDFRLALGGNPVGFNAEIMKALLGNNPKKMRLQLRPGQELDAEGQLLDPWGTPYFFHQLSAKEMEILCAGPDRILWNQDDLKLR